MPCAMVTNVGDWCGSLQVFSIPRVGKSVDDEMPDEDVEYSFTSHDKNYDGDDDVDDDVRTINDRRRRNNVFSKIPRVGRSRRSSSNDPDGPGSF